MNGLCVRRLINPGGEELEHELVEREGVLDGEAVRRAGDDREIGAGDALCELFSIGGRREDVLAPTTASALPDEPIKRVLVSRLAYLLRSERAGRST